MSADENKTLVRRYIEEVWSNGSVAAISAFVADDFVAHGTMPLHGPQEVQQFLQVLHTAFPDYAETIEDQVAEGDRVVTRWTGHGTHQGAFMGVAATGRPVTITAIVIDRVASGKVVEEWEVVDLLGLLQQLGALPAPTQAPA